MTLAPAMRSHAAALAFLHARAFPRGERWGEAAMALQLEMPGTFGWISFEASDAGGLVLARVAADEAEILTLAVDPAARRRGLGRALLQQAIGTARMQGARRIFLEVAQTNRAARALYAGSGFTEVGRRRAYYRDGSDALVLQASIVSESRVS